MNMRICIILHNDGIIIIVFMLVNSEFLCVPSCVITVSLCAHYITDNKPLSLSLSLVFQTCYEMLILSL